jgi:hypothetical protein
MTKILSKYLLFSVEIVVILSAFPNAEDKNIWQRSCLTRVLVVFHLVGILAEILVFNLGTICILLADSGTNKLQLRTLNSTKEDFIWYGFIYVVWFWWDRHCGLVVRVLGYRSGDPGSIPALPEKQSSGSGTGSTQPREYN